MKKTLIALAVLGAVGAAHAQSNVTIYGQLNPSYDIMKVKDANAAGDIKTNQMSDNSSRLGFKGTEDLGNGLKALFQMEAYFNVVDQENGGLSKAKARDSFVGLQGNWGTFRMGTYDPVYKKITASYDPFGDTIADYNSIMGVWGYDQDNDLNSRYGKVLGYATPVINGFQGMVDVSWSKEDDDSATYKEESKKLDLGATYKNGPLQVLAAYSLQKAESNTAPAGDREDLKAWKIGASYVLPTKTKLSAIYEDIKQDGVVDTKHVFLGVEHPINNIDLLANFMWADDNDEGTGVGHGDDSGAKAFNLGVRYNFSKRTNVMAMYTMVDNDDNGIYGSDAGYGVNNYGGSEVSGVSVRLQHKF